LDDLTENRRGTTMLADQPIVRIAKSRWFCLTPGHLFAALPAIEAILLLTERWLPKGWAVLIAIACIGATMVLMFLWFVLALLFRWRFQFSIRSLLLLTVAVAIPFSWLAVEMKQAREQEETVKAIRKMPLTVYYDFQYDYDLQYEYINIMMTRGASQPGAAWLRKMLGDDFFQNVGLISFYNDKRITDADLERFEGLTQLRDIYLGETQITDIGLGHLKGLKQLQMLMLERTNITDAGMEYLEGLLQLQELDIDNTKITDAGLERLKKLVHLKHLHLAGTQVTDAGVEKLKKALPKVKIDR
jgi:hypothetical protein